MKEADRELYFEHLRGQAQFAYFQLGVAASAIAYAVHETDGDALRDTPWPIGLAVVLWAVSFVVGCAGVDLRQKAMLTNLQYLELMQNITPRHTATDPALRAATEQAKAVTQAELDKPWPRFRAQLWTLFAGGLAYVAGHIMAMAAVPPQQPHTPAVPIAERKR